MFKKIISRKVMTFFMLHITFSVMYYFNANNTLIWAIFWNGMIFISFNTIDKMGHIRENIFKNNKE